VFTLNCKVQDHEIPIRSTMQLHVQCHKHQIKMMENHPRFASL